MSDPVKKVMLWAFGPVVSVCLVVNGALISRLVSTLDETSAAVSALGLQVARLEERVNGLKEEHRTRCAKQNKEES